MRRPGRRVARLLLLGVITALACAGEGTGLDEFGNPIGERDSARLEPTWSSIQARIFTPICTQCHAGSSAPLGLSLEVGVSYGSLVNVPSVQVPALRRVHPGAPDSSYVVLKLEGAAGIVGERMPFRLEPLSTAEIAAVRTWIARGAPRD